MTGNETTLVRRNAKRALTINRVLVGILVAAATCLPQPASAVIGTPAPAIDENSAVPSIGENSAVPSSSVDEEAVRLREALRQEIPRLITDELNRAQVWVERTQAAIAVGGYTIQRPQLLVVVDRNPRVQQMRVVLARSDGAWQSLGGTKVSTGRPGQFERFLTPTGVFRHTAAILDWRAEGTFNEHHVRGLGLQGMRIWDFGWQQAIRGWGRPGVSKMRLLLHATDPATLERRIGRAASDGCVRIPTEMDRFLDAHGVLDRDYEQAAQRKPRFAGLLLPGRTPTPLAGDALVIIDTAENPGTRR